MHGCSGPVKSLKRGTQWIFSCYGPAKPPERKTQFMPVLVQWIQLFWSSKVPLKENTVHVQLFWSSEIGTQKWRHNAGLSIRLPQVNSLTAVFESSYGLVCLCRCVYVCVCRRVCVCVGAACSMQCYTRAARFLLKQSMTDSLQTMLARTPSCSRCCSTCWGWTGATTASSPPSPAWCAAWGPSPSSSATHASPPPSWLRWPTRAWRVTWVKGGVGVGEVFLCMVAANVLINAKLHVWLDEFSFLCKLDRQSSAESK